MTDQEIKVGRSMQWLDFQVNRDVIMDMDLDLDLDRASSMNHSDLDIGKAHGASMVKVITLVTDHGANHHNKNEIITVVEDF